MIRNWRRIGGGITAAIEVLPLAIPAALTAFGIVAVSLLLMGQLKDALVWPLGILAAVTAVILVVKHGRVERPGSLRERRLSDWLVIVGVIIWGGFNMLYASQHIQTNRDPATYGIAGVWLVNHDNLKMEVSDAFGSTPRVVGSSAGFHVQGDGSGDLHAYAQGMHLLPAFLGLSGRIVGEELLLRVNPFFGMTALLAVYGFARLLVRPRWAVIATGALAASLPLIYFSRDTYTESLALTFTFGALSLLWIAQKYGKNALWLLAGLVTGAGVLTRVDAYLTIAGVLAFAAVILALAPKQRRRQSVLHILLLVTGMALPCLIGFLDVSLLSPGYFKSVKPLLKQEFLMVAGIVGAGIVATIIAWRTDLLPRLDAATRRWRGPAAVILLLLIAIGLVSRPLWMVSYAENSNEMVSEIQRRMGDPLEARTYAEQTANWIAWYIGPLFAVLGVMGAALVAKWAMIRRDLLYIGILIVVLVTALVYLVKPSITPDQIWASRRMLPVVMPGMVIFGAVALDWLHRKYFEGKRFEWWSIGLISVVLIASPLAISKPFLGMREMTQLALIEGVCKTVPRSGAVLWIGMARLEALQPTKAFCGIDASGYNNDNFKQEHFAQAAQAARRQGKIPYIGVYGSQLGIFKERGISGFKEVARVNYPLLQTTLDQPPRERVGKTESILLGILQNDGTITSIEK